jgi:hypothetical protein
MSGVFWVRKRTKNGRQTPHLLAQALDLRCVPTAPQPLQLPRRGLQLCLEAFDLRQGGVVPALELVPLALQPPHLALQCFDREFQIGHISPPALQLGNHLGLGAHLRLESVFGDGRTAGHLSQVLLELGHSAGGVVALALEELDGRLQLLETLLGGLFAVTVGGLARLGGQRGGVRAEKYSQY